MAEIRAGHSVNDAEFRRIPVFRWPFGRRHVKDERLARREGIAPELLEFAALAPAEVLQRLHTSERGLSHAEAARRRDEYGENKVAHEEHETLAAQLLRRLLNPLNILLLTLAAVSVVMGDREAALIIFAMVVLSLSLAIMQERRSSKAAEKLRAMVRTTAAVVRMSETSFPDATGVKPVETPIQELVPGDIVHLSAGDMIPADLRLISAKDLFINQASLTGEALPVEKHAQAQHAAAGDIEDLSNICFMGTAVVSGSATGVIALTGPRAYFGRLADVIAGERALTNFDKGITHFAWLMIRFILVMAPLVSQHAHPKWNDIGWNQLCLRTKTAPIRLGHSRINCRFPCRKSPRYTEGNLIGSHEGRASQLILASSL